MLWFPIVYSFGEYFPLILRGVKIALKFSSLNSDIWSSPKLVFIDWILAWMWILCSSVFICLEVWMVSSAFLMIHCRHSGLAYVLLKSTVFLFGFVLLGSSLVWSRTPSSVFPAVGVFVHFCQLGCWKPTPHVGHVGSGWEDARVRAPLRHSPTLGLHLPHRSSAAVVTLSLAFGSSCLQVCDFLSVVATLKHLFWGKTKIKQITKNESESYKNGEVSVLGDLRDHPQF